MPDVLTVEHLKSMNDDPIVFAMANPDPEIAFEHVRIIATGRCDYPSQINNVPCFPGLFRGAHEINEEMKLAAARGIVEVILEENPFEDYIIPSVFDERVSPTVAEVVAEAGQESGMARHVQEQVETDISATTF